MGAEISRRAFLAAGATSLGAVALAACAGGGRSAPIKVDQGDAGPSGAGGVNLVIASYIHVVGIEQRVTIAFLKGDGPVTPVGPVQVAFRREGGKAGPALAASAHHDGPDEHDPAGSKGLDYYVVRNRFDQDGVWYARTTYKGRTLEAPLMVSAAEGAAVPYPGRPLISTPTPTVADGRGVNPICTRQPACPLHDISLDEALPERRPLAVLFSTPALCQSRLCGPTLDNLLSLRDEYAARVRFLHVEIYTDLTGKTLAPAVQAFHLDQEPILFLAGADGVVRDRLDNAVDAAEMRQALDKVLAG